MRGNAYDDGLVPMIVNLHETKQQRRLSKWTADECPFQLGYTRALSHIRSLGEMIWVQRMYYGANWPNAIQVRHGSPEHKQDCDKGGRHQHERLDVDEAWIKLPRAQRHLC